MTTITKPQADVRATASWRARLNDETLEPLFVALTLVGLITGAMLAHAGAPTRWCLECI